MSQNDTAKAEPQGLRELALNALKSVCSDEAAPAAAKAAAARTLLEACGAIGRNQEVINDTAGQDLASMSAADLDKEIRRLSAKR